MVVVAALSPENRPFLEEVHLIFLSIRAHFEFLVPVELLHLRHLLKRIRVLIFLSLRVNPTVVPFHNLLWSLLGLNDMQVQPVVRVPVFSPPLKFLLHGVVVILPAVFGQELIVQLSPGPDAELRPARQDTESLADVPDSPTLQVAFVDGIDSLRRQPAKGQRRVVAKVDSGVRPTCKLFNVFVGVDKLPHSALKVSLLIVSFPLTRIYLHIHSLLNYLAIIRDRNVFIRMQVIVLYLFTDKLFFLVFFRQLVNKIVNVLCVFLRVQSFKITEVAVLDLGKVRTVSRVVAVVRKYWVDGLVLEPA
jgi:hypothetical protein